MVDKVFVVKNGLVSNGTFIANSTVVNAAALTATSVATATVTIGGVNVNTMISGNATTAYTNATSYADAKAATAYTNAITIASNATNLTSGTVPNARLNANVVNTSAAFTITGVHTHQANIIFTGSPAGIIANGTIGTTGQLLASNGTGVYWATVSGVNTSSSYSWTNAHTFSNTVNVNNSTFSVGNTTVNTQITLGTITLSNGAAVATVNSSVYNGTANNASFFSGLSLATVQGQITGNATTAYTNATSYADTKAAAAYANAIAIASNATNLTSGTVPNARLSSAIVNTSAAFTIAGVHTHSANIAMGGSTVTFTSGSINSTAFSTGTNTATIGTAAYFVSNGNFGIGTAGPGVKLEVNGAATVGGILTGGSLVSSANTTTIGTAAYVVANGNVGVGTTTPAFKVAIKNDANNAVAMYYSENSNTGVTAFSGLIANTNGIITKFWSASTYGAIGTDTNHLLHLFTNSTIQMTVGSNGNIGIGTATPNAKLQVVGNANISGNVVVGGGITATDFTGSLNADNINAGTLSASRMSLQNVSVFVGTNTGYGITYTNTHIQASGTTLQLVRTYTYNAAPPPPPPPGP